MLSVTKRQNQSKFKPSLFPSSVYENKLVDFLGYPTWQVYGTTEATADFGNEDVVQGGDRLKVDTTDRLRFELPVGMVRSANAGGIVKAKIAGKNEYTFEYEIRFELWVSMEQRW